MKNTNDLENTIVWQGKDLQIGLLLLNHVHEVKGFLFIIKCNL